MSKHDEHVPAPFKLPPSIISRLDISRLVREFEALDNALASKEVREKAHASEAALPAQTPQLAAFLEANPVNLDSAKEREAYIKQLRLLKKNVHIMNMTFAVTADPESLQQLSAWVREAIHPHVVLEAHLQPALVAGAYIRSQNHVFDFSVRNALVSKRGELKKEIEALRG